MHEDDLNCIEELY